jgi:polyisoprenoid-binding protein YceI
LYSIDNSRSKIEIDVYKAGLFKAFGHDHLIGASEMSGRVEFDAGKVENSSATVNVAAKSLAVLDPGESEKNRRQIQATMSGPEVLDIANFPEIAFSSTGVTSLKKTADGYALTLEGKLSLHGVVRPVSLPLQLHLEAHRLAAQGELFLQQTDYGIAPVSVAAGSVKVKDRLRIGFTIVASRIDR